MTSFVHLEYSTQHPGVVRAGNAINSISGIARNFDGARGTASLLLAAVVAGLLVVTSEIVSNWTDGHALAAWIMMWAVAFAGLALLAAPIAQAAIGFKGSFQAWNERRLQAAEDDKLWNLALTDARVMAELSRAMSSDAASDIRKYY